MWSSFPLPYHVLTDLRHFENMASGFAGEIPLRVIGLPLNHYVPILNFDIPNSNFSSPEEDSRKFILNRYIYDLVEANQVLQLTDPQLLRWYLSLAPEDRQLILVGGGFHQFLQRHPALELSHDHVYVKYSGGDCRLSKPTVTSNLQSRRPTFYDVPPFDECGASCPSGAKILSPNTLNQKQASTDDRELECLPNNVKESLDLMDHCEDLSGNAEGLFHDTEEHFNVQSRHQEAHNSQWREDSRAVLYKDSVAQATVPLDIKLDQAAIGAASEAEAQAVRSHTMGVKPLTVEMATSPLPCVVTVDVSTGTEPSPAQCVSAVTQTERPATADKHILTMVHMADLDYLTKEFVKLKSAQRELHKLKEQLKSSDHGAARELCSADEGCGCGRRAQRAELRLLALQYTMCQQHTCSHYSASPDHFTMTTGDTVPCWPEGPPAKLVSVCRKLQCDYKEMQNKILAGVSLEQLEPLSVHSQTITTSSPYIPAQIICDAFEDITNCSQALKGRITRECGWNKGPLCRQSKDSEEGEVGKVPAPQSTVSSNRAAPLLPEQSGTRADDKQTAPHLSEEVARLCQTSSKCKELSASEAWYDAKEDLDSGPPTALSQLVATPSGNTNQRKEGSSDMEKEEILLLLVSDLPKDVTENDVMQLFGNYHPSEVKISTFTNNLKVAIVAVNGPQTAEAAVGQLNGVCMQGKTLHVAHITPVAGRLSRTQQPTASSQMPGVLSTTELNATETKPSNTTVKIHLAFLLQVPGSSLCKQRVLNILPMAKGTFVPPEHYATMSGFDKLIDQLRERHPEAGRQVFVDTLLELKKKHKGVLNGLPLSTIVEMVSEQLSDMTP